MKVGPASDETYADETMDEFKDITPTNQKSYASTGIENSMIGNKSIPSGIRNHRMKENGTIVKSIGMIQTKVKYKENKHEFDKEVNMMKKRKKITEDIVERKNRKAVDLNDNIKKNQHTKRELSSILMKSRIEGKEEEMEIFKISLTNKINQDISLKNKKNSYQKVKIDGIRVDKEEELWAEYERNIPRKNERALISKRSKQREASMNLERSGKNRKMQNKQNKKPKKITTLCVQSKTICQINNSKSNLQERYDKKDDRGKNKFTTDRKHIVEDRSFLMKTVTTCFHHCGKNEFNKYTYNVLDQIHCNI